MPQNFGPISESLGQIDFRKFWASCRANSLKYWANFRKLWANFRKPCFPIDVRGQIWESCIAQTMGSVQGVCTCKQPETPLAPKMVMVLVSQLLKCVLLGPPCGCWSIEDSAQPLDKWWCQEQNQLAGIFSLFCSFTTLARFGVVCQRHCMSFSKIRLSTACWFIFLSLGPWL